MATTIHRLSLHIRQPSRSIRNGFLPISSAHPQPFLCHLHYLSFFRSSHFIGGTKASLHFPWLVLFFHHQPLNKIALHKGEVQERMLVDSPANKKAVADQISERMSKQQYHIGGHSPFLIVPRLQASGQVVVNVQITSAFLRSARVILIRTGTSTYLNFFFV